MDECGDGTPSRTLTTTNLLALAEALCPILTPLGWRIAEADGAPPWRVRLSGPEDRGAVLRREAHRLVVGAIYPPGWSDADPVRISCDPTRPLPALLRDIQRRWMPQYERAYQRAAAVARAHAEIQARIDAVGREVAEGCRGTYDPELRLVSWSRQTSPMHGTVHLHHTPELGVYAGRVELHTVPASVLRELTRWLSDV